VGPHGGAGEDCENEGEAEIKCDKQTVPLFPVPLLRLEEGCREYGSENEPGK